MAMSWRMRRRLSLLILVLGLPAYIVLAVLLVAQFDRPSPWLELGIYVGLGVVWALPLKAVFRGVGRAEPEEERRAREDRRRR